MYIDKVLLAIALCATSAWCAADGSLMPSARTIGSSSFLAWPSMFRNLWPVRPHLWDWIRSGVLNFTRLTSSLISSSSPPVYIDFRPEDGPRAAVAYQRRFGYRGERLIEQLGNGLGPDIPPRSVPNTFLTPPPPTF